MATLRRTLVLLLLFGATAWGQGVTPRGIETGGPIPALSGVDLEGNPVSLASYLGQATVVLSLWSIHCSDCIRELDDMKSIRREFPAEDVTVVAVNMDSGLPIGRVAGFVRRYEAARGKLNVVHLLDRDSAILDALGIQYIPVLIVVDRSARVSSVLTGYSPENRPSQARAMEEGRVALGAWGEGLPGRLRTILRSPASGGRTVEWGSFRVEEGMALFGLHDAQGWLTDAAGRRDRELESRRVEEVVADRLKVALLRDSLASVGIRLPAPDRRPFRSGGVEVPESPFRGHAGWKRLFDELNFSALYREEDTPSAWVDDEYWAALVGDVDLGRLRSRLDKLDFPTESARIHVETVSDYDYKARAVMRSFRRSSYRLQALQGEHVVYYGGPERLARELAEFDGRPFKVFTEVISMDEVRLEVF
jgi:peroxiredoxin